MPIQPFGLCNVFDRLMETVLDFSRWETALVYLDDVIVFGSAFEEQVERLGGATAAEEG